MPEDAAAPSWTSPIADRDGDGNDVGARGGGAGAVGDSDDGADTRDRDGDGGGGDSRGGVVCVWPAGAACLDAEEVAMEGGESGLPVAMTGVGAVGRAVADATAWTDSGDAHGELLPEDASARAGAAARMRTRHSRSRCIDGRWSGDTLSRRCTT